MEQFETNLITLTRHTLNDEHKHETTKGDLTLLLVSIQVSFVCQWFLCVFVSLG